MPNPNQPISLKPKKNKFIELDYKTLRLALGLGYTIAVPLVLLALGGRLLDKYLHTSPLFILISILASLVISTISLVRKVTPIIKDLEKPNKKK